MLFFYLLFVSLFCATNTQALNTFVAASYEHAVIIAEGSATPKEALDLMNRNMDILETAVKKAAEKGAHIIVTPEVGLFGWNFDRESISPFLEDIPDPKVDWIPCTDPERFGLAPVQERLSCMARNNSIYVVASMGDKKPCNVSELECPDDGQYNYNTAVVYDSDGKLVARYHKHNLFLGEIQYNSPTVPDIVSFDTPFGKFGIFICFDILFYYPSVALVVDKEVDTILFPTAWMNVLPHLSAIEFHSAWAMGMRVNLISANTHKTTKRMTGSGIFSPNKPGPYYYSMDNEEGFLLISELDVHPRDSLPNPVKWDLYASSIEHFPSGKNIFQGTLFDDKFTFTELQEDHGDYTICQNDLCCHLNYKMVEKLANEIYVLGVFNGMHLTEGEYYLQICTFLKCESTDFKSCGESTNISATTFESFSLSGTFSTSYVFPEVLMSGVNLAFGKFQTLEDGRLVSLSSISSKPLLSATLFGRWYEKDPPKPPITKSVIDPQNKVSKSIKKNNIK
ncbi:pantetheinase [Discoglossus pictus]